MLILLEFLAFLSLLGGIGWLITRLDHKASEPPKRPADKGYTPPITPDLPVGGPEQHIRTHDIGNFWVEIGRPTELGTQVEVNMQSGKIAIYELVHKERATGTDWNWYDLEFIRYKDSPQGQTDRP